MSTTSRVSLVALRRLDRWRGACATLAAAVMLAAPPAASAQALRDGPDAAGLSAGFQSAPAAPAGQGEAPPPAITAGSDGFVIQSANGDYRLQFGLLLHADGRFALDDEDATVVDTFGIRRLRPSIRGRLAQRFEFYVNPDFANSTVVLQDAYFDTRFSPAFIVRLGKAKAPVGLERLIPVANMLFFERALPTALVPNRDVGVQVLGDLPGGIVSYAAGVMNGVADGGNGDLDTNDGKDLVGRIAIRPLGAPSKRPLSGLTVALAGTTGNQSGPLATIRTSSLLQNFLTYTGATADGRLTRITPAASYYFARVTALAEYVHTRVPMRRGAVRQEIAQRGWQLAGSYVLTSGDSATERGVRPQHNFDFGRGHLGALQVAARYHTLSVDDDAITLGLASAGSSREATAWTAGLNWFLNPNLKYVVEFERTVFDGNEPGARHPETGLAFRAQVSF